MHWDTLGDLTTIGMKQLYTVGQTLREHYITNASLLPPRYNYNKTYIRASSRDRCFMSAHSLLTGLYPTVTEDSDDSTSTESYSAEARTNDVFTRITVPNSLPASFQVVPVTAVEDKREVMLRGYSLWYVIESGLPFSSILRCFLFFFNSSRSKDLYSAWTQTSEPEELMEQYADEIAELNELLNMTFSTSNHDTILDSILVDYVHKFLLHFCFLAFLHLHLKAPTTTSD